MLAEATEQKSGWLIPDMLSVCTTESTPQWTLCTKENKEEPHGRWPPALVSFQFVTLRAKARNQEPFEQQYGRAQPVRFLRLNKIKTERCTPCGVAKRRREGGKTQQTCCTRGHASGCKSAFCFDTLTNRPLLMQTGERCYDYLERDKRVCILRLPDLDHAGGHLTQGFLRARNEE